MPSDRCTAPLAPTTVPAAEVATIATPVGPFTVIAEAGMVLASGWTGDADRLWQLVHPSLRAGRDLVRRTRLPGITEAVAAYHRGDLASVDGIAVCQRGGAFTEQVWAALRRIRAGQPVTYAELASRAGHPVAIRAAASACAANACALFVPCHRVIRTGGGLGGFGWGLDVKQWLLAHEAAVPTGLTPTRHGERPR